jgi:hypothetical protein
VIHRVVQAIINEKSMRGINSNTAITYFPSVYDGMRIIKSNLKITFYFFGGELNLNR